ncbi:MAG: VOC family protein [Candidatus Acidiferrales bacterium]|jgi:methylmalonyl-CoA/ethylmalonyl-CoA epimerase
MADTEIHLGTIGQIAIPVTNIETSLAFYRDKLGLKFLFQVPNLAFFDCGGIRLMLDVPQEHAWHNGSPIYFKVPDMGIAYESLQQRGVPFEGKPHLIAKMPDHEIWMAFFRDPDRNLHALMCEKR